MVLEIVCGPESALQYCVQVQEILSHGKWMKTSYRQDKAHVETRSGWNESLFKVSKRGNFKGGSLAAELPLQPPELITGDLPSYSPRPAPFHP